MKKIIIAFTAIALTAGVYAQGQATTRTETPRDQQNNQSQQYNNQDQQQNNQNQHWQDNTVDQLQTDGVMMQNGKIMKVENGQVTVLEADMNLSNGTRVTRDGSYYDKDGIRKMLKEGEHMDMTGNMVSKDRKDTDRLDKDRKDTDRLDKDRKDNDRDMYLVPDSTRNRNL